MCIYVSVRIQVHIEVWKKRRGKDALLWAALNFQRRTRRVIVTSGNPLPFVQGPSAGILLLGGLAWLGQTWKFRCSFSYLFLSFFSTHWPMAPRALWDRDMERKITKTDKECLNLVASFGLGHKLAFSLTMNLRDGDGERGREREIERERER